uniref:Transmembrane protein n=1 Tax=Nelumbo nucifera TaxID=4432 RepID=A0A822YNH7_NELNU|nr:TPA_asm: hypothetical protein HUJ06_011730 [Nelumbo nucifera]
MKSYWEVDFSQLQLAPLIALLWMLISHSYSFVSSFVVNANNTVVDVDFFNLFEDDLDDTNIN